MNDKLEGKSLSDLEALTKEQVKNILDVENQIAEGNSIY